MWSNLVKNHQLFENKPFYFVRHGVTVGNVNNICQGHIDYPLTETGIRQAREAGQALKDYGIKTIATSTLGRAQHTAKIIAEEINVSTVQEYAHLMERGWGELEGLHNSLMFSQEEKERMPSWDGTYTVRGIETKEELFKRINDALCEVLTLPPPVLIVGHGRFLNALCEVLGVDPIRQIPNGVPLHCSPRGTQAGWEIIPLLKVP